MRASVLLPEPDSPTIARVSLSLISRSTLSTARLAAAATPNQLRPPKLLTMERAERMGSLMAGVAPSWCFREPLSDAADVPPREDWWYRRSAAHQTTRTRRPLRRSCRHSSRRPDRTVPRPYRDHA